MDEEKKMKFVLLFRCRDLHLSPGDVVYVVVNNGSEWCFGGFDVDSFHVFSYSEIMPQ